MHWEELQLFLSALSRAPGLLVSLSLASPVQVLDPQELPWTGQAVETGGVSTAGENKCPPADEGWENISGWHCQVALEMAPGFPSLFPSITSQCLA